MRISSQLPRVDIVGLPEAAVRESASRVRAAIGLVGAAFPGSARHGEPRARRAAQDRRWPRPPDRRRRSSPPPGRWRARASTALRSSESSRSTGACARCAARSRWRSPSRDAGCRRLIVARRRARPRRPSRRASTCAPRPTSPPCSRTCAAATPLPRAALPADLAAAPADLPDLADVRGQERAKRGARDRRCGRARAAAARRARLRARPCSRSACQACCRRSTSTRRSR